MKGMLLRSLLDEDKSLGCPKLWKAALELKVPSGKDFLKMLSDSVLAMNEELPESQHWLLSNRQARQESQMWSS